MSGGRNDDEEMSDSLHMTFKENAMFLLDLASNSGSGGRSTDDDDNAKSGPWAVGEFKCLADLQVSDSDHAVLLGHREGASSSSGVRNIKRLLVEPNYSWLEQKGGCFFFNENL